ncbi:hypothetical protein LPJ56_001736 [Coemansia sp. RSA 2599]|nr:hypothetical protein LPJ56_001736 [Coemansia sp. RSA 2599]
MTEHTDKDKTLEEAVDGLYEQSVQQRGNESAAVEDLIVQISDTSGRLFTDSFAPWHERDGVTYAEYMKQLKIARASE